MENAGRPAYKEQNFVETLFFVYSILNMNMKQCHKPIFKCSGKITINKEYYNHLQVSITRQNIIAVFICKYLHMLIHL